MCVDGAVGGRPRGSRPIRQPVASAGVDHVSLTPAQGSRWPTGHPDLPISTLSGRMSAMPCSERQQRVVALPWDGVRGELRVPRS
jgi:hypothetical protein